MKQGDYVLTKSGLLGKIVWDGKVPNKGYVFGIELVEWSETGNDGSYNGKHYFRTSPGHGMFSYERNLTLTKAPTKKNSNDSGLSIGDKVSLRNGKAGTIQFIGCIGSSTQEVIGIKLSNWTDSGHDGKGYFTVPMGYGYFAKLSAIASCTKKSGKSVDLSKTKPKPKPKAEKSKPKAKKSKPRVEEKKAESAPEINSSGVKFKVGDTVRLNRGREGVVKFIGTVGDKRLCGLELDAWSEKGNNGSIKDVQYFTCKPGRGYFTACENVAEVLVSAKIQEKPKFENMSSTFEEKDDNVDLIQIALGDKVRLRKGRVGHVRFIGKVKGLKSEIVGLELLQWFDRGNNGNYGEVQYFSCKEGTGYWTSRSAIDEVLSRAENASVVIKKPKEIVKTKSTELDEPIIKFGIGDVVRLKKGREGTVKYYNKKSQIVGMELKNWNADCGDGTYKGKEFFKCDKGRGYFTSAKAVNEVLKRALKTDFSGDSPKREELNPLSIDDDSKNSAVKFQMGDKVRLKRGKIGTVKYIGKTNFAKGVVVGLELNSWNEKGNDGSVNGKRFFTTRGPGWGYFTKPDAIAEVLVKKA